MTIVHLGYVAMSMELKNVSPSQTMTFAQFQKIVDRDAAIRKLERIALYNSQNTPILLKYSAFSDIHFYRLTSRFIPLANHEELLDWNYLKPLKRVLREIEDYAKEHKIRIGFHPDHFVLINSKDKHILGNSVNTLKLWELMQPIDVSCMLVVIIKKRIYLWHVLMTIGWKFHGRFKK